MANFPERLSRLPRRWMYVCAALVAGGGLLAGMVLNGDKGHGDVPAEVSLVVSRQPFVASVSFTGRIAPGDRIDLAAPFDAAASRVNFAYGDQVEAGQVLVELDPGEVRRNRAEAEIAWLKAEEEAFRMQNWAAGSDMRSAQRAVTAAEDDLNDLRLKLAETRALLDRGLVPRSEYDGLVQQLRQKEAGAVAARETLADTARRGQGGDRRIALLQRDVARSRYAATGGSVAVVRAPQAGVIVRPDSGGEQADKGVHAGSRLSKGQLLGVIASAAGLDVVFTLDETDLNIVVPGQRAVVTGPGLGAASLHGTVTGVAGEADRTAGTGKAVFTARVRLDPLSGDAARNVRIGMTANIRLVTYENPAALVVPPQAVLGSAPQAAVMVRTRRGQPAQRRAITIGRVAPAGVEVLSGLEVGEIVVWERENPEP